MENRKISFTGKGSEYFGIWFVNSILTVLTLGIYGAWARVRKINYFASKTVLEGDSFTYHGTGLQVFIGYLKLIFVLAVLYGLYIFGLVTRSQNLMLIGLLILVVGLILIIPLAIHGAMRFRLSHTSWRGIHMGYRGSKSKLFWLYLKGSLLTILTLGLYSSWFTVKLNTYIYGNVRLGNVKLGYRANGLDLFIIHLKGALFSLLTMGIYSFWYSKNLFNYTYSSMNGEQDGRRLLFNAEITAGQYFKMFLFEIFALITFGLAMPWATVYTMKTMLSAIEIGGEFDPDAVIQTEEDYSDAKGDGFLDLLDIDIGDGIW